MEKLKAGIFDSLQIRKLTEDPLFDEALSKAELSARQSLKSVVTNFLGNHEKEIEELLKNFCQLVGWMSVKLPFLWSHLDYFPNNCEDLREKQGECFH